MAKKIKPAAAGGTQTERPLQVRIDRDLVTWIDEKRGLTPRETYINHFLDAALDAHDKKKFKLPF